MFYSEFSKVTLFSRKFCVLITLVEIQRVATWNRHVVLTFFIGRRQKVLMNTLNFLPCNDHPLVYFDGWRNCQQLRLRTVDVSWSWWASHAIDTVGSWIFPTGGLQQLDHDKSVFCWLVVIPTQETLGFWLVNNYDLATHTSIYISYVYIICIPIFPFIHIYIFTYI